MNIFYYCKKSDRVIGNRDLIANPFFQGYSRSDFDWILDHFLAKWSGFDCQSQKKWSVTTMEFDCRFRLRFSWMIQLNQSKCGLPPRRGLKLVCFRPLCSMNKSLFAFLMFVWNQYYPASIFPWFFIVAIELWSLPSIRFYKKTKATNADLNTFISVMSRLKVQSKVLVFWLWPGG